MSILWEEKEKYITFNPRRHHIADTCGGWEKFIPYKRRYGNLSLEELFELIQAARDNKWQALDLCRCGLDTLPDELWTLPDLKMLYLGNHIPRLSYRETFTLGDENTFHTVPVQIENLDGLQVLSLCKNRLSFEYNNILKLQKLIHLDIFNCEFEQIPNPLLIPTIEELGFNCLAEHLSDEFWSLRRLRRVYLTASSIVDLPENIGSLSNLQEIYLVNSQIASLPSTLIRLRQLSKLALSSTPLAEMLPPEILKQSAKEIVRYVLALQSDAPKQYFNESKMVIVGQGHVGKSSLLNRLVNDDYSESESTEGIDISAWHFVHDGQPYKLNIWDFGGQEIYHSTHQFFLTSRSLYLLVWDALAEDEYGRIDYWLKTIQSLAQDSPVIIVVNKCDKDIGRLRRIDDDDYKTRYPQIKDVVYVSCKDNVNIDNLRNIIYELAVQLPLMKTTWLSSWMDVRKELEQKAKDTNFIQYSKYLEICSKYGVEASEARSLIKYLHDLGIVLYYQDDICLKNIVILSSEWGTDAVYKVLDEQEQALKGRNGILYTDDLPTIWNDSNRYPQELYPHLLGLMKKFQLAFEMSSSTYLVAELLNNQAINLDLDFKCGETLSFRYEYDFLPAGILTRFIVSINQHLETINNVKQCWKKGAYLRYRTAYALVRLNDNIDDRSVQILVSGSTPRDKQELLTIIRDAFNNIHTQFSQIKITEKIPCNCQPDCKYYFNYETLLRAEQIGKMTLDCLESLQAVNIRKLLDGVEPTMENKSGTTNFYITNSPNISPYIQQEANPTVNTSATSTSDAYSENNITISIEIKNEINGLLGDWNDLKNEVGERFGAFLEDAEKVDQATEKLGSCKTKDDVVKSGALNKIGRFLKECHDPNSEIGKILAGVKYAADIVKNLAGKYNKIAKWVALPQLPFGDS